MTQFPDSLWFISAILAREARLSNYGYLLYATGQTTSCSLANCKCCFSTMKSRFAKVKLGTVAGLNRDSNFRIELILNLFTTSGNKSRLASIEFNLRMC